MTEKHSRPTTISRNMDSRTVCIQLYSPYAISRPNKSKSVIDCEPTKESIRAAIHTLYSTSFQKRLSDIRNPYGDGGTAERIVKVLKETDLTGVLKKKFYNIQVTR